VADVNLSLDVKFFIFNFINKQAKYERSIQKMDLREKVKSYLHDTGCTVTNFCKKIGISTVYYYKWIKKEVEFSDRLIGIIGEFLNDVYAK